MTASRGLPVPLYGTGRRLPPWRDAHPRPHAPPARPVGRGWAAPAMRRECPFIPRPFADPWILPEITWRNNSGNRNERRGASCPGDGTIIAKKNAGDPCPRPGGLDGGRDSSRERWRRPQGRLRTRFMPSPSTWCDHRARPSKAMVRNPQCASRGRLAASLWRSSGEGPSGKGGRRRGDVGGGGSGRSRIRAATIRATRVTTGGARCGA